MPPIVPQIEVEHRERVRSFPRLPSQKWCPRCDEPRDCHVVEFNGQVVGRCGHCGNGIKNLSREELGLEKRSFRSRPDLRAGQRDRILDRDHHRCCLCGREPMQHGVVLNVCHILGVAEGRDLGASDDDLFDDSNLFAGCEECNADTGPRSLSPIMFLRLIRARLSRNGFTGANG